MASKVKVIPADQGVFSVAKITWSAPPPKKLPGRAKYFDPSLEQVLTVLRTHKGEWARIGEYRPQSVYSVASNYKKRHPEFEFVARVAADERVGKDRGFLWARFVGGA